MAADQSPHFVLEADFSYTYDEGEEGDIESFLDQTVTHLEDELGADDVTLVLDKADSTFSISLLVPSHKAESIETVVGKGMGLLRTSFHACNAGTPNWPTPREALLSVRVTFAPLIDQEIAATSSDVLQPA